MNNTKLIHGDCLEEMQKLIQDNVKVDLILSDLPYGTTQCKWDNIIPFDDMWDCINQLCNERTPIVLFGSEPFSSHLRLSNLKNYRYDWVWDKEHGTNFLNANRMPLPSHELISVFYNKLPYYNPQKHFVGKKYNKIRKDKLNHQTYGEVKKHSDYIDDGYRFPLSIIHCKNNKGELAHSKRVHPTQKPVKLMEYLVKTYTKENDLVLDFTMGSGSTGVACQNLNRRFIGIEKVGEYFEIAKKRLNENSVQRRLL